MWKLPDWGTASGWNAPTTYYIIIMDYASVITLDEQHACNECSNTQTHRIQKYVNWTTSDFTVRPQILLSDLRIYSTTSEFTVRPQNLQYDLRIYSTTSEFTVRPQSFTVRPGFLEVQILVQPDPAEVYYLLGRVLSIFRATFIIYMSVVLEGASKDAQSPSFTLLPSSSFYRHLPKL